jgi:hypothetical protein
LGLREDSVKLHRVNDHLKRRLQKLFATPEAPELGPGPRPGVRPQPELEAELKSILRETRLAESSRELLRSLVLLWHDHLDASHTISQGIENPDGSLLHAIMHRREPDFWNSKYWWRRVGAHPVHLELARRVTALLDTRGARVLRDKLLAGGRWDAGAFVDACERPGGEEELLRAIQRLEFEVALEYFAGGQT